MSESTARAFGLIFVFVFGAAICILTAFCLAIDSKQNSQQRHDEMLAKMEKACGEKPAPIAAYMRGGSPQVTYTCKVLSEDALK